MNVPPDRSVSENPQLVLLDDRSTPRDVQAILRTAKRFRALGYRETKQGVRLYGPLPSVARQAWCHAIPPGLSDQAIGELCRAVGANFVAEYRQFLHAMNGAHLFVGALALYGLRPAAGRDIDSAFLPFDMVTVNLHEKPKGLRKQLTVIGGYSLDGSLVACDAVTGHIERVDRDAGNKLSSWTSLSDFICDEVLRLDAIHDNAGRLITEEEMLVPPLD